MIADEITSDTFHSGARAKPASRARTSALPERGGAVQPIQMLAQLALASGEHLVVPFEDVDPGASGRAAGIGLSKQFDHKIVRYTDIVRVAEVILQSFQLADKLPQIVLVEQAAEKFARIAELFGGDSQLVALTGRQPVKPPAALAYPTSAPIEYARGDLVDRTAEKSGCFGF
jgi:hypothetical protein